jgi:hypothetical protein
VALWTSPFLFPGNVPKELDLDVFPSVNVKAKMHNYRAGKVHKNRGEKCTPQ